jgi:nitrogen fixation protein FixH
MKKLAFTFGGILILVGLSLAAPADRSFSGEIMDSACVAMSSHSGMMSKEGGPKTAKTCTAACVKSGAKYVLYNSTTKRTYQLDDQAKPAQFAGDKVTVKGTYDMATTTIHVTSIAPAS